MMAAVKSTEFADLEVGISSGFVRTFRTKAAALKEAGEFGWGGRAIRVSRRFEVVWIVGELDVQPDEVGNLLWDVLRVPELKYRKADDGVMRQAVLRCRKFRRSDDL